jgi:hypothetical protein
MATNPLDRKETEQDQARQGVPHTTSRVARARRPARYGGTSTIRKARPNPLLGILSIAAFVFALIAIFAVYAFMANAVRTQANGYVFGTGLASIFFLIFTGLGLLLGLVGCILPRSRTVLAVCGLLLNGLLMGYLFYGTTTTAKTSIVPVAPTLLKGLERKEDAGKAPAQEAPAPGTTAPTPPSPAPTPVAPAQSGEAPKP